MELNTSERRVNQEVADILKGKTTEPAFEGTVLEGRERCYTIINERDVKKYVPMWTQQDLSVVLDKVLSDIEVGREKDGKKPFNSYVVVNVDEPYIGEIVSIMEKYGHWDGDATKALTFQQKLDLLNSMDFIDIDGSGTELTYVLVEYTDQNITKLARVVPDVGEYIKNVGDPDGRKEDIEISIAAFQFAGADSFSRGKFVIFDKDELLDELQEATALHAETIRELQRIQSLVFDLDDPVERPIGVALKELEEKYHQFSEKWNG